MGQEEIDKATTIWNELPAEVANPPEPVKPAEAAPAGAGEGAPAVIPGAGTPPAKVEGEKLAEGAKPAGEEKPPETPPDAAQLAQQLKPFQEIMESAGIQDVEALKGTVADAMVLYDVLDGQQKASALLEAVKATQPPEVFQRILADVAAYAAQHGIASAPPKPGDNGKGAISDPLEKRIGELEAGIKARGEQEAQVRLQQDRMEKIVIPFQKHIAALGKKEGLDEDDIAAYSAAVSAAIGQDKEALKRLEAGKMGDVDRFFTLHDNQQVALMKKRNERLTAKKTDAQNAAPRIPAGGAPPAPSEAVKLPPAKTAEERIARSTAIFRGETPV